MHTEAAFAGGGQIYPWLFNCYAISTSMCNGRKKGADFDFFDFINAVKMMFAAPDVWVFYFVLMLGMSSPTLIELKTQIDKSKQI
ncbi:hypothetical protein [Teredinibacter turnerae]|uniref:hypothetical protein n=1 Tax=Teredinibacter turnerae TaxID=2426 RepID=UPI0030D3E6E9